MVRGSTPPRYEHLNIVQLNMQRSRVVSDEMRVMMDRAGTDVLLMQEHYDFRGAILGFGTGTRVITGCSKDERTMAAVALRGKRVLIATDTNAKSPLWWSDHLDHRGEKLEEFLSQHDLMVVNSTGLPVTFSSPVGEANHQRWTSSNHQAIAYRVNCERTRDVDSGQNGRFVSQNGTAPLERRADVQMAIESVESPRRGRFVVDDIQSPVRPRLNIAKANWDVFRKNLRVGRERLAGIEPVCKNDVERMAAAVEEVILSASSDSIPEKRQHARSVPWWIEDLTRRKRPVYKCRRLFQKETDKEQRDIRIAAFHKEKRAYLNAIKWAKTQSWEDFVSEQGNVNPWGMIYKSTMQKLRTEHVMCSIQSPDGYTKTWRDTTETLLNALISDDNLLRETEEQALVRVDIAVPPSTPDSPEFGMGGVRKSIAHLKPKKCPGRDKIKIEIVRCGGAGGAPRAPRPRP
ncbi:hypothetical protein KM043_012394 [Ampulex compressa]|nr:hypothetical protein KM043_012394 [Ampulex compressa]